MKHKVLRFQFHMSDSNNEDVEPLLYGNWMAVADGLGSTGSAKHAVPQGCRASLETVLSYVCNGYRPENPNVRDYLSRILSPCMQNEVNTSALWASRIVMARFLWWLEMRKEPVDYADMNVREALARFIKAGLAETKRHLNLQVAHEMQGVLPTTFAALHYANSADGTYRVDAMWAGDSRCYLLCEDGLQLLSRDDENEFGEITNLFSADRKTNLQFKRYTRIKPPFILICASDGFFDRYKTTLQLESRLLTFIQNGRSEKELRGMLLKHYTKDMQDDTSVAFVPIGFTDYRELQAHFARRTERVNGLHETYKRFSRALGLRNRPERQVTVTVASKFRDDFDKVIRLLSEAVFAQKEANRTDILLASGWEERIKACMQTVLTKMETEIASRKKKVIGDVGVYLHKHMSEVAGKGVFKSKPASDTVKALRKNAEHVLKIQENSERLNAERQAVLQKIQSVIEVVESEKRNTDSYAEKAKCCDILAALNELEAAVYRGVPCEFKTERRYKEVVRPVKAYLERKTKHDPANDLKKREKAGIERYEAKLKAGLAAWISDRSHVFKSDFIAKMNMDTVMRLAVTDQALHDETVAALIAQYGKDPEAIRAAIHCFAENPDGVSAADELFVKSKLADFREFYKIHGTNEAFAAYREELGKFEEALRQFEQEAKRLYETEIITQGG